MLSDHESQTITEVVAAKKQMAGPLLPILHAIQEALGCIPAEGVEIIARGLNLSRAEVHGVVSYYHHFRAQPAGRSVVQICRAESCQSRGAEALWKHACAQLACADAGGTSPDGAVTLEPVYCLGLCASSPAMTLNHKPHARVSLDKFNRLLDQARSAS